MLDLGVELNAVEFFAIVCKCRYFAIFGGCYRNKPFGKFRHGIVVVHPNRTLVHAFKEGMVGVCSRRPAVFAHIGSLYLTAVDLCDVLHSVAYAEHGYAKLKHPVWA